MGIPDRPSGRGPLVVRGARTHNLKNIDVTLPSGKLIIITGVSGSGKSSLAFDTIYAEGQRRYVESLSAYARQFLERMEKPDVDRIEGICPAIAIRQKNTIRNPRSTVGTTTEIHDYMRLLFARVGRTYCRQCGQEVVRETAEVVARRLGELPAGTRLLIGFDIPFVSMSPEEPKPASDADRDEADAGDEVETARAPVGPGFNAVAQTLEALRRRGYGRLLIDGRALTFEDIDPAMLRDRATLQVIVDRLRIEGDMRSRLTDSIETSYREGGGAAFAVMVDHESKRLDFSERFECRPCGITYETPQPRLFSFNNPFGACPTCHGFGNIIELDMDLVVPDQTRSISQGAIEPWSKPHYRSQLAELKRAARTGRVRLDVPWEELSEEERGFVIDGRDDYEGVRGFFRWLERKKYKVHVRVFLSRYRGYLACSDCGGSRLRREARNVRVGGATVDAVSALTVQQAQEFFAALRLSEKETVVAEKVLREIRRRLSFLSDVGLDYLTLDRLSSTLSGGESQRINLATSLGSALVGTLYVLDEPSIGLHSRDNQRLIAILRQLRDQGNTVLVVEHDEDMIRVADHVVDIGLGAGEQGGRVVFSGDLPHLLEEPRSLTAKYSETRAVDPCTLAAPKGSGAEASTQGRERAQPEGRGCRDPAQHDHVRHWREWVGQVHARARRVVCGHQALQGRLGSARRQSPLARGAGVHHRRRVDRPDTNRPDPAVESGHVPQGVRSDPRAFLPHQGCTGERSDREPLFVQRAGRPVRGVSGRRRGACGDAVPCRRLRPLRPVQRQAFQADRAGSTVSGEDRAPGARDDRP